MDKKKDWNIQLDSEDDTDFNNEIILPKNKTKKRIPVYARMLISTFIYIIIYTVLNLVLPDLANYIHQIVCFILAILGFILASYKDHKNKVFNEIYGKED